MISAMAAILYASAVIIPQFAQQVIGYTATWAGLILSPGGVVVILLIPVVGQMMKRMQTRYIIAIGFTLMGFAFVYSRKLTPDIDFDTLMWMRMAQTGALAFMFVPITTVTFLTLPRELNTDGSALFAMFRNVFGSIGISLATSQVTQRSQVHQTYLSQWMTPLNQPYNALIASYERTLLSLGRAAGAVHDVAIGLVYQTFLKQAVIMAYSDIFLYCAVASFLIVPLCFLVSPKKAATPPAGVH